MAATARLVFALLLVSAAAVSGAVETSWIPVVAHAPGLGGSLWRSDVAVLNTCSEPATVELLLHTGDGVLKNAYVIDAGRQQIFNDVVAQLTDDDAVGALEIRSDVGVTVSSRTYNLTSGGTYGQGFDGVTADRGMAAGTVVHLPRLEEYAASRTNVGILNMGGGAASVSVTLFDRNGNEIGSFALEVPPGRTVQDIRPFAHRFGREDVLGGYARVTVDVGEGVFPYASVVDISTGDPTTVLASAEPSCPVDIAERLAAIDDLVVEEVGTHQTGYRYFELEFLQPADHGSPEGERFAQKMGLLHRSFAAPTVLNTNGYGGIGDIALELTRILEANQLVVEHRFYGDSVPASVDWTLLRITQAAADHHRIAERLKTIYTGTWISAGHSKGGMTAVYHRRFYPEDVHATVAYVAPISFGAPDERYIEFLANVGEPACNEALWALQREALERRDAMVELLEARYGDYSFDRIGGYEAAVESVVIELPFSFWQFSGATYCSFVPSTNASDLDIFDFIDASVHWWFPSDFVWDALDPYFYQAHAELGYPAVARSHIADLLEHDAADPEEGLLPEGVEVAFDPEAMLDIADWLATEGSRMMFIYGENDPWSGGAFELGDAVDSHLFVQADGTHAARISTLPRVSQIVVRGILERWTGVEPRAMAASKTFDGLHPRWRRMLPAPLANVN